MNIDLNAASNMFGPLSGEIRARLMAAIKNPGDATWEDVHGIELNSSGLTLWQAVREVDPSFPQTGPTWSYAGVGARYERTSAWERTPTAELLVQAISFATR